MQEQAKRGKPEAEVIEQPKTRAQAKGAELKERADDVVDAIDRVLEEVVQEKRGVEERDAATPNDRGEPLVCEWCGAVGGVCGQAPYPYPLVTVEEFMRRRCEGGDFTFFDFAQELGRDPEFYRGRR